MFLSLHMHIIIVTWFGILALSCPEAQAVFLCLTDRVPHSAWLILLQVFLCAKRHGDLTASFARGVSFFLWNPYA